MKTRAPQTLQASASSAPTGPLSPALAFVVQFRERATAADEAFGGRVEHIISGDAARFVSSDQLLAFFERMLSAAQGEVSNGAQSGPSGPANSEEKP